MFKAWKRFDQLTLTVKTLWAVIAILVAMNGVALVGLMTAPHRLRVFVPPDLTAGATLTPEHLPKATVYAFAFQIFSAINSWTISGTQEYAKNLSAYHRYLSPAFASALQHDLQLRSENGELDRQRLVSAVSGQGYSPNSVKPLGNGTWLVHLHLQLVETLDGQVIKRVVMAYPLIVARVQTSLTVNPWGLVLSGYQQAPYRLKTLT